MNEQYKIKINKYFRDDLILQNWGVYIIGSDYSASELRVPKLNNIRKSISSKLIAECGLYIYIPEDLIPKDDMIYEFPKPTSSEIMNKWFWKKFKTKYTYKGNRLFV